MAIVLLRPALVHRGAIVSTERVESVRAKSESESRNVRAPMRSAKDTSTKGAQDVLDRAATPWRAQIQVRSRTRRIRNS